MVPMAHRKQIEQTDNIFPRDSPKIGITDFKYV